MAIQGSSRSRKPADERFDAAYYARFYSGPKVHDQSRITSLLTGIIEFAKWWRIDIRSVLDVGAGSGFVKEALKEQYPNVKYQGTDISRHACKVHGYLRADIATWIPTRTYDLTICLSVLQYVDDDQVDAAVENLATATNTLLYLEVPTKWDRSNVIDESSTDLQVSWRTGSFYRKTVEQHFQEIGAGLWLRRSANAFLFELERTAKH